MSILAVVLAEKYSARSLNFKPFPQRWQLASTSDPYLAQQLSGSTSTASSPHIVLPSLSMLAKLHFEQQRLASKLLFFCFFLGFDIALHQASSASLSTQASPMSCCKKSSCGMTQ